MEIWSVSGQRTLIAETRGRTVLWQLSVERLQRSHAVQFFAQRVTREVAGQSHLAQFLVRETKLQRTSDTVMDQSRQERVPDVKRVLGLGRAGRGTFVEEGAHLRKGNASAWAQDTTNQKRMLTGRDKSLCVVVLIDKLWPESVAVRVFDDRDTLRSTGSII